MFTYELFRDEAFSLTLDERSSDGRLIVFFPHRYSLGLDPAAEPGRAFAEKHGLNSLVVRTRRPNWFTEPSFEAVLDQIDRLRVRYPALTFSGASMGGYGAIRAAERVPANVVLAFSPLAAIGGAGIPEDRRFRGDLERVGPLPLPKTHKARAYVVLVDDSHVDQRHLGLIGLPGERMSQVPVTGSRHGSLDAVKEAGLLSELTLGLHGGGGFDLGAFAARLKREKRRSKVWVTEMIRATIRRRPQVAQNLLQRFEAVIADAELAEGLARTIERQLRRRDVAA